MVCSLLYFGLLHGPKIISYLSNSSAKSAVYFAKKSANEKKFGDLNSTEKRNTIFKMARKMKEDNKDIIG